MRAKTHQQTFSQAIRGMLKQGALSQDKNFECLYRFGDLKCVAGQLIPDRLYSAKMEGKRAGSTQVSRALKQQGHDPVFVSRLQCIHDDAQSFADFVKNVEAFAGERNLKMPKAVSK